MNFFLWDIIFYSKCCELYFDYKHFHDQQHKYSKYSRILSSFINQPWNLRDKHHSYILSMRRFLLTLDKNQELTSLILPTNSWWLSLNTSGSCVFAFGLFWTIFPISYLSLSKSEICSFFVFVRKFWGANRRLIYRLELKLHYDIKL